MDYKVRSMPSSTTLKLISNLLTITCSKIMIYFLVVSTSYVHNHMYKSYPSFTLDTASPYYSKSNVVVNNYLLLGIKVS